MAMLGVEIHFKALLCNYCGILVVLECWYAVFSVFWMVLSMLLQQAVVWVFQIV